MIVSWVVIKHSYQWYGSWFFALDYENHQKQASVPEYLVREDDDDTDVDLLREYYVYWFVLASCNFDGTGRGNEKIARKGTCKWNVYDNCVTMAGGCWSNCIYFSLFCRAIKRLHVVVRECLLTTAICKAPRGDHLHQTIQTSHQLWIFQMRMCS
jgi:hypothetical protein